MRLFYAAPVLLGPGSTVLPGNYYRMLRCYGEKANFFTPFRELVFEEIRRKEFPAAVSRLDCVFCCETENGLADFLRNTGRALDEMYEVETVGEEPTIFRADWNIVKGVGGQKIWDQVEAMAWRYWSTKPTKDIEVLSAGPVRVIRRIPSDGGGGNPD